MKMPRSARAKSKKSSENENLEESNSISKETRSNETNFLKGGLRQSLENLSIAQNDQTSLYLMDKTNFIKQANNNSTAGTVQNQGRRVLISVDDFLKLNASTNGENLKDTSTSMNLSAEQFDQTHFLKRNTISRREPLKSISHIIDSSNSTSVGNFDQTNFLKRGRVEGRLGRQENINITGINSENDSTTQNQTMSIMARQIDASNFIKKGDNRKVLNIELGPTKNYVSSAASVSDTSTMPPSTIQETRTTINDLASEVSTTCRSEMLHQAETSNMSNVKDQNSSSGTLTNRINNLNSTAKTVTMTNPEFYLSKISGHYEHDITASNTGSQGYNQTDFVKMGKRNNISNEEEDESNTLRDQTTVQTSSVLKNQTDFLKKKDGKITNKNNHTNLVEYSMTSDTQQTDLNTCSESMATPSVNELDGNSSKVTNTTTHTNFFMNMGRKLLSKTGLISQTTGTNDQNVSEPGSRNQLREDTTQPTREQLPETLTVNNNDTDNTDYQSEMVVDQTTKSNFQQSQSNYDSNITKITESVVTHSTNATTMSNEGSESRTLSENTSMSRRTMEDQTEEREETALDASHGTGITHDSKLSSKSNLSEAIDDSVAVSEAQNTRERTEATMESRPSDNTEESSDGPSIVNCSEESDSDGPSVIDCTENPMQSNFEEYTTNDPIRSMLSQVKYSNTNDNNNNNNDTQSVAQSDGPSIVTASWAHSSAEPIKSMLRQANPNRPGNATSNSNQSKTKSRVNFNISNDEISESASNAHHNALNIQSISQLHGQPLMPNFEESTLMTANDNTGSMEPGNFSSSSTSKRFGYTRIDPPTDHRTTATMDSRTSGTVDDDLSTLIDFDPNNFSSNFINTDLTVKGINECSTDAGSVGHNSYNHYINQASTMDIDYESQEIPNNTLFSLKGSDAGLPTPFPLANQILRPSNNLNYANNNTVRTNHFGHQNYNNDDDDDDDGDDDDSSTNSNSSSSNSSDNDNRRKKSKKSKKRHENPHKRSKLDNYDKDAKNSEDDNEMLAIIKQRELIKKQKNKPRKKVTKSKPTLEMTTEKDLAASAAQEDQSTAAKLKKYRYKKATTYEAFIEKKMLNQNQLETIIKNQRKVMKDPIKITDEKLTEIIAKASANYIKTLPRYIRKMRPDDEEKTGLGLIYNSDVFSMMAYQKICSRDSFNDDFSGMTDMKSRIDQITKQLENKTKPKSSKDEKLIFMPDYLRHLYLPKDPRMSLIMDSRSKAEGCSYTLKK